MGIQEEKAEWIIYVTDEGQSKHFKSLFGSCKKAGIIPEENPPRIDHVTFGVVLNKHDGKRIRTRDGGEVSSTRRYERLTEYHLACMLCGTVILHVLLHGCLPAEGCVGAKPGLPKLL